MKKYYSENLNTILEQYIPDDKYGEFTPLVKDIMQRRAYEYEFLDSEMEYQVKNFVQRFDRFEFQFDMDNINMKAYCLTDISAKKNRIVFNLADLGMNKMNYKDLLVTLTHEIYHVISGREDGNTGLTDYKGRYTDGTALNEAFVELGSSRNVYSNDYEMETRRTIAYPLITFAPIMLAAATGVSEKEMLKAGLQDRDAINFLVSRECNFDKGATSEFQIALECFEFNFNEFFKICHDSEIHKKLPFKDLQEIAKRSLSMMYNSVVEMTTTQIESNNRNLTKEEKMQLQSRYEKINSTMDEILNDCINFGVLKEKDKEEILSCISNDKEVLQNCVENRLFEKEGMGKRVFNAVSQSYNNLKIRIKNLGRKKLSEAEDKKNHQKKFSKKKNGIIMSK